MKRIKFVFLCFIFVSVVSCASGPEYSSAEAEFSELADGKARIFFYMEPQLRGFARPWLGLGGIKIVINGKDVGEAVPGTFFFVDVSPGEHELTDREHESIKEQLRSYVTKPVKIANNETKFIEMFFAYKKLFLTNVAIIKFRIIDPRQAKNDLKSLKYRSYRNSFAD